MTDAIASETHGVALSSAVPSAMPVVERPYRPSLLDASFDAIVALPGPTWLAYGVLTILSIILANAAIWLSGLKPLGELEPTQVFWGVATVAIIAASHRLKVVAGSAFDAFQPALGSGIADAALARYELTTMPARPIVLIALAMFAFTPLYYIADPVAAMVVGLTPIGFVPRLLSEALMSTVLVAILYQALRQMRTVSRLHAAANQIDPFRPAPLYAFSRLTAQVGIVLIATNALGSIGNPAMFESASLVTLYAPWLIGFTIVAIAVFVVPLRGMHGRLVVIKDRLEGAADGRMRDLIGELNEAIDARETSRVDGLDRTISALRHEREILAKLPTWPWSGATIRGFASALFLPIALFLIQRFLSQFLS